jgi:hypothetical protein
MSKNNWTVIACSNHKNEYLHLKYLKESNPDAQIIKLDFTNPNPLAGFQCDMIVRDWFLSKPSRINNIKYNNVALVEYDVLITQRLPDIKLNNELLCHKKMIPETSAIWRNWPHILRLEEWKKYAVGCMPFSLYFMSKNCLDILINKKYDQIYKERMCCEVRLPSILNRNKIKIESHPSLRNIKFIENNKSLEFNINTPGLYHPVKYSTEKFTNLRT